jgi:hypothetical protein
MTREIINTGSAANDGTGDTLRSGANKINANFQEIYEKFGTANVLSSRIEFDSDEIKIQGVSGNTISIGAQNPTSSSSFTLIPFDSGTNFFVLDSAVQTLKNKTLDSATLLTPLIGDLSENHYYKVRGSELVADRTITLPLLTGDDTVVTEAHTQTLTNKTLDSAELNNPLIQGYIKNDLGKNMLLLDNQGGNIVNVLAVGNSVSGNDIDLIPSGTDSDINLRLRGKGNKAVLFGQKIALDFDHKTVSGGTYDGDKPLSTQTVNSGVSAATLPSGTIEGQIKYINNRSNFRVTVTGTFHEGTQMLLDSAIAHLMWDNQSSKWRLVNAGHPNISWS